MEADDGIEFLSLRKVAMQWVEEVEGATHWKVQTNAMEAVVKTSAGQVDAVGPADEMQKMWAELASQRRQLTEGLAEQGKVLTEVLAQQRLLMGSTTAMLPPFGQQAVTRRRLEDIVCFGHTTRAIPTKKYSIFHQWAGSEIMKPGVRWSLQDKMLALSIFYHSRKAYTIIGNSCAMPSKRTIQRALQKCDVCLVLGFSEQLFEGSVYVRASTLV